MAKTPKELKDLFANIIFPGDDGEIEHVDMKFEEFMKLINSTIDRIHDDTKEIYFKCNKCSHLLFINLDKKWVKTMMLEECPECGEESEENWLFMGYGDYDKFARKGE